MGNLHESQHPFSDAILGARKVTKAGRVQRTEEVTGYPVQRAFFFSLDHSQSTITVTDFGSGKTLHSDLKLFNIKMGQDTFQD